jgi:hypothetical protein
VARGEVAEEDGALVGEGGDGWQRRRPRRHRSSSLLGGFGARTAARGSNGNSPRGFVGVVGGVRLVLNSEEH